MRPIIRAVADLTQIVNGVRAVADEAAALLTSYAARLSTLAVRAKSSAVDLVSEADETAERLIQARLSTVLPQAGFLGEEKTRTTATADHEWCWVVDPLDGTSNFLAGVPFWAVSIALVDRAMGSVVGVIKAPALSRTWHATRGGGSFLNSTACAVRPVPPGGGLHNAMLATGFPYAVSGGASDINIVNFIHMQRRFHKIRRMGSAAIDLAFIADGTFDGMWELLLQPWDSAAGILLVKEAGGCVSRFDGAAYTPGDEDLLAAATPELLRELQAELAAAAQSNEC